MSAGLVAQILRFHLAAEADASQAWDPGVELPIRVDHVLTGGRAGLLALAAFRRTGRSPQRIEVALAGADRGSGAASFETPEELAAMHELARYTGIAFSRPGHGRTELVHREQFAAPGKILLAAGRRVATAAAVGMVTLAADPIEVAAVLCGSPYYLRWPGIRYVSLEGIPGPGTSGHDVFLALAARAEDESYRGRFLEFMGDGIEHLSMADRFTLSGRAPDVGVRCGFFPADDVTRAYLRAQNRESQWKRLAAETEVETEPDLRVDLSALEPMFAELDQPRAVRRCRDAGEPTVSAIEIGVEASLGDLARIARSLGGRSLAAGVRFDLVPGSRQVMETARSEGWIDRLVAAGVRVLEVGTRSSLPAVAEEGLGVCFGVRPEDAAERRGRWIATSPEACAAAAVTGRLVDPRTAGLPLESLPEPSRYEMTSVWVLRHDTGVVPASPRPEPVPPMSGAHAADEHALAIPMGPGITAPLRGSVLIDAGDAVPAEQILPWGARLRPLIRDVARLGDFAMVPVDAAFPERARAAKGGFVIAGTGYGQGVSRDPAALALMALGVRAVIADSFGSEYHRQLLNAGVLPLRFAVPAHRRDIGVGDELEIPGLPEGLEPGFPLVVRNLTRGTQFTVKHDLNSREVSTVLAGGLLGRALAGVT